MAPRRRPRTLLIPPRQHCWVESDAYDRSAFATLRGDAPSLAAVLEAGGMLVPHFDALLEDIFCLLFKLEPRLRPPAEVAPAAALNRTLLDAFRDHPLLEHLRVRTQLEEIQAGLGTLLVGRACSPCCETSASSAAATSLTCGTSHARRTSSAAGRRRRATWTVSRAKARRPPGRGRMPPMLPG